MAEILDDLDNRMEAQECLIEEMEDHWQAQSVAYESLRECLENYRR